MILKAFSVYDTKALNYGVPFFMPSAGSAVRAFGDLAVDGQSMVSKHPSDYILYEVGYFDDAKAILTSHQAPVHLGVASDFIPVRKASVSDGANGAIKALHMYPDNCPNWISDSSGGQCMCSDGANGAVGQDVLEFDGKGGMKFKMKEVVK